MFPFDDVIMTSYRYEDPIMNIRRPHGRLIMMTEQFDYFTFWYSKVKTKYIHKILHTGIRLKADNKNTSA